MTDEKQTEEPADTITESAEADQSTDTEEKPEKLHQTVEMKDIGPCKKHIKVTIDHADIDSRLNEKFSKLVVDSNVAGFRPGKAPRKIIERRFAKDVGKQVKGEVMLQSLEQLAEENDIAPLSEPNLDPSKIEMPADGPMVYEFDVEVRPQFDLPDYKGLKLKRPIKTFGDEDVRLEQNRLLSSYGQLVPKEKGKAEMGDYLIADMTTRDGDQIISELKEVRMRIEPQLAFKDAVAEKFGKQTIGAKAGDERVLDIKLSDNSADEKRRGKVVKATLAIQDVKTMRLPELTPEFLEKLGVENEDKLRETVRVLLNRRLEYTQRQSARQQVLEQIAQASSWELPRDLLMRQARRAMARRVMEMRANGISEDEIRGRTRLLERDILASTALALKEHFVLQKIAEVEKIDVDDDDISNEIERMAYQSDESPRRVRARLEKEDMLEALAIELVERKALDLILDSAEYQDVPLEKAEDEAVATVEEQAVPGEMRDLREEAEEKTESSEPPSSPEQTE
jgi:trigger factor